MPKYEERMENYEDALLALLVDKCMEKEGERYLVLNKELKRNAAGTVPPGAYERGLRTIDRIFRKQHLQTAGRVTRKFLTRIAVAVCCLVLLFATAFAVSPAVREQVYALVKEVMPDSTELTITGGQESIGDVSVYGYSAPVLPEGFVLSDEQQMETYYWRRYIKGNDACIQIVIKINEEDWSHSVDTEDAECVKPVVYSNFEGLYVEKAGVNAVYMVDTSLGTYVTIVCEGVDAEAVLKIAENLHYVD